MFTFSDGSRGCAVQAMMAELKISSFVWISTVSSVTVSTKALSSAKQLLNSKTGVALLKGDASLTAVDIVVKDGTKKINIFIDEIAKVKIA
jgi:hypothetical protein